MSHKCQIACSNEGSSSRYSLTLYFLGPFSESSSWKKLRINWKRKTREKYHTPRIEYFKHFQTIQECCYFNLLYGKKKYLNKQYIKRHRWKPQFFIQHSLMEKHSNFLSSTVYGFIYITYAPHSALKFSSIE